MQRTIAINDSLLQKAQQAFMSSNFNELDDFIAFLIEAQLKTFLERRDDPILRLRGKLKRKNGGTALFIQDKQAEIDKEYAK